MNCKVSCLSGQHRNRREAHSLWPLYYSLTATAYTVVIIGPHCVANYKVSRCIGKLQKHKHSGIQTEDMPCLGITFNYKGLQKGNRQLQQEENIVSLPSRREGWPACCSICNVRSELWVDSGELANQSLDYRPSPRWERCCVRMLLEAGQVLPKVYGLCNGQK